MKKTIQSQSVLALRTALKRDYINKYYNLFMNSMDIKGLTDQEINFIMRKFWGEGTVAAFMIKNVGIGFAPYAIQSYNMYDFPDEVLLINKRALPFIPSRKLVNEEDVVLGWIQPNHKSVFSIVEDYIDRMVSVDMVINTNLQVHKLPFLVGISPTDEKVAKDIIAKILSDETVIFADLVELNNVKSLAASAPYIIDKLYMYRTSLENELLTFLGLDNNPIQKKERAVVDEINANNEAINANQDVFLDSLESFFNQIQETFGVKITVEAKHTIDESAEESRMENSEDGGKDNEDNRDKD